MDCIKCYFGVALLSLVLVSCQKDTPVEELPVKEEAIVSAISLQEAQEKLSQERMNASLGMLPDWESFSTEEVVQGFEYSQVRTSIFNSEVEGEMVFFKVRDTLLSYLLMHQIDEEKPAIERYVFFTPDGFFVDGYVFEEGEMTHRMVPSKLAAYEVGRNCREIQKLARKNGDPDWKLRCYDVEEVVVVHNREKNANKCKNVTGKSGSCETWLSSPYIPFLYDCLPDDIDCMDRKTKAEIEAARQDMAYHKKKKSGGKASGSGVEKPDVPDYPDAIVDELTHSCTKSILANIRNRADMKSFLRRKKLQGGQHNFSEMIIDLFEKSKQVDLIFKNGTTENNANASTLSSIENKTITITFSNRYLRTATRLAVARTMIHEMVHAYLDANFYSYGNNELKNKDMYNLLVAYFNANKSKYPQDSNLLNRLHHEFMGEYIDLMALSLQDWDMRYGSRTDLGYEYYKALSYGGLFQTDEQGKIISETDVFQTLVKKDTDRQEIANKLYNEQYGKRGAKGTRCK